MRFEQLDFQLHKILKHKNPESEPFTFGIFFVPKVLKS